MSAIPPVPPAAVPAAVPPAPPLRLPAEFLAELTAAWPQLEAGSTKDGTAWLRTTTADLLALVRWLQARSFVRYLDCTVVDDPQRSERFELQYLLYSMQHHCWLRLKARTAGSAPSLVPVFAAADWFEREVFDLFGVQFEGHPGLCRILLPDDFVGHPLRRDVPLGREPVDFTVTREIYGT